MWFVRKVDILTTHNFPTRWLSVIKPADQPLLRLFEKIADVYHVYLISFILIILENSPCHIWQTMKQEVREGFREFGLDTQHVTRSLSFNYSCYSLEISNTTTEQRRLGCSKTEYMHLILEGLLREARTHGINLLESINYSVLLSRGSPTLESQLQQLLCVTSEVANKGNSVTQIHLKRVATEAVIRPVL